MADELTFPVRTPGAEESARALGALGDAIAGAGDKFDTAKRAFDFNQIRQAITSVLGDLNAFAEAVTRLASEQAQLDANSARLGLNFDAAAEAAGRFTDETEVMTAATRLSEAGIRLNQSQLEQLTRVAANFAQNTGVTTREALDKLTNGLITGAQEGLRPFGGELRAVAGETHTAEERLAALATQAGHTAQATDDAATSFARMKDSVEDAARSLASGFAEGVTQMMRAGEVARATGDDAVEMQRALVAVGQTAGEVATRALTGFSVLLGAVSTAVASIVGGIAAIGAGLSHIVSTRGVSGTLGAMQGAFTAVASPFASFTQAAYERLLAQAEAADERETAGEATRTRLGRRENAAAEARQQRSTTAAHSAAGRESDPLEDLKEQIRLNQQLMRIEDARAEREHTHRERETELARLAARTDSERRAITEATLATHGLELERQRALTREQIAGNDRLVAAIERRAQALRGSHLAEAHEQIRALHQSSLDITNRLVDAEHRLAVESATYEAAERDRLEAKRRAFEESQKTNLRERADREKLETPEAARQARENDLVRRRQSERLAATETYQERLRGLYEHEMDLNASLAESSTAAFSAMGDAFAKHVEAVAAGSETVGEALQGYLADVLAAISKEAFVKSAFYFAQGVGQLAGVVTAPLAPASFAASAAFAAVGALTGVGAAAVRPAASTASGEAPARAASVSGAPAGGGGGGTVYNITFGGPMYGTGGVRQAARQMVGAINRGGIQGGVQLLPGVLQGAGAGA